MKNVILKTESLCKSFSLDGAMAMVLKNINVELYEGDFTVIMGSSGSGKSTLLYAISSMDKPTSGSVMLMDKDITKLSEKEISAVREKDISFIFQSINLIPDLTAFENIAYPAYQVMSKKEANEKTVRLLTDFGMENHRDKYPSEMSGGQQQRIAVARAVVTDPKILFADEPTGALNSSAGNEVLDLFTKLHQGGQSIVMVTHDMRACARGNRLIYLCDGEIAGDLELGLYSSEQQKAREETVFAFLNEHHW